MDPVNQQLHIERRERIRNGFSRREWVAHLVASVLLVAACGVLALVSPVVAPDPVLVVVLVAVYAAFWQVEFEVAALSTSPLQVAFVPMWFAVSPALVPLLAVAAQIVGNTICFVRDRQHQPFRRALVRGAFAWYGLGPAIVLACFGAHAFDLAFWPVYALALVAQFATDLLSNRVRFLATRSALLPLASAGWMFAVDTALAPIGLLAALAMQESTWTLVAVLPLALLLGIFAKERDMRISKAVELSSAYRGTAQLMGDVLEADDAYTGGEHTQGVVGMALAVGQAIGLDDRRLRDLEFGALLHDIGKLRVPNEIINKPGKLTDEEWAIIKQHPGFGQEMLNRVGGELTRAGTIVRAHHERWDGQGYPDHLAGEDIPIEARIITICDSFSAMTTDRSYRKGMSDEEAVAELERCSGSQFDPSLVDVMIQLVDTKPGLRLIQASAPSPAKQPEPAKPAAEPNQADAA